MSTYSARHKKYYITHRKKVIAKVVAKQRANPLPGRKRSAVWAKSHPKRKRDTYYRFKYGISLAVYNKMLKVNSGCCWICSYKPGKGRRRLSVDHDHRTLEVRGLLCRDCNRVIVGRRKTEHAPLFEQAAAYLRSEKDWRL